MGEKTTLQRGQVLTDITVHQTRPILFPASVQIVLGLLFHYIKYVNM